MKWINSAILHFLEYSTGITRKISTQSCFSNCKYFIPTSFHYMAILCWFDMIKISIIKTDLIDWHDFHLWPIVSSPRSQPGSFFCWSASTWVSLADFVVLVNSETDVEIKDGATNNTKNPILEPLWRLTRSEELPTPKESFWKRCEFLCCVFA